jgi:hypothetical protein
VDQTDGTAVTVKTFSFEVSAAISEADYLARNALERRRSRRGWMYLIGFTALGVAALFSRQTAPFGGIALAICAFAWTAPTWSRWSARRSYKETKHIKGPLTYGVSDQKLWFRGGNLYSESTWDGLGAWEEIDGELRLAAHGMPVLYFSVAELRDAGVYEQVQARMTRHGVEYGSPAANRLAAT